ncbi:ATP-binding cassette subfamily G member 4-like isoform X2 [Lutzomyia longipalpis]|uniref:ATP-binding cassette subfamily G member 4-like isoform X2 n=1 Tax=Lutzomyia longipalpis TaxID=7200 RepID=UPI0024846551|nr:ATP-binding cassette subfamily G member 4-like isoform X2 [Lutzomyia longipalpis]
MTTFDDGEVLINGKYCNVEEFRKKSCYILQDFALHKKLTVLETLKIAADLKLSSKVSGVDKTEIVLDVLRVLGLDANLETQVDRLSGGECKRLSIGVELLTNPPVMFLDEPTSGLDSVSACQVVSHLKNLARAGRNVVCVIHQPSSRLLEFFDDIYVISHGQCIYSGPLSDVVEDLKGAGYECPQFYNRADFLLEVASGERPGDLSVLIERATKGIQFSCLEKGVKNGKEEHSELSKMLNGNGKLATTTSRDINKYPTSQWQQFRVLLKRSFICISRDMIVTQFKIIVHFLVGLLIGFIYYNVGNDGAKVSANISLLFFIIMFLYFSNSIPIVLFYPYESKIFYREYLNNWYGFLPYVYSKILSEIPCLMISILSTFIPIYYLSSQPVDTQRILLLVNIYLLTGFVALFAGLAIGTQFDPQLAIFMMPAIGLPLIVFSGYFIHYNELPVVLLPLTWISFFRYIFEGSFHAIYSFNRKNLDCHQIFCYFRSVPKILDLMDMKENTYTMDVLGIIGWIVLFKILFLIALKMKVRQFTR